MKVLILSGIYPPDIGGPATHSHDLAVELRRRGHQTVCVTLTDEPRSQHTDELVRFPRQWPWPVRTAAIVVWMRRHRRAFDVVYSTGLPTEAMIGSRIARRPLAVKMVGDPAWERGVRQGLTTLGFDEFQRERGGSPRLRAMRALRTAAVRRADAVIVPSRSLQRVVEGWGARDVAVVRNGVRVPEALATNAKANDGAANSGGGLRVITVSRLVAHKGIDTLIDAASRAGVHLDIVGDGPDRERLQQHIARNNASGTVRVLGDITHDDAMARVADADVFALASRYEGLPHAVIEALVVGTPVVSAPTGGVGEAITDGTNGLLVDPPTVEGFVDAFTRLRDDPAELTALATGAIASREQWGFGHTADDVESVLSRLTGGGRSRDERDARPQVVFVGKTVTPADPGPDLRRKLSLHAAHLRQVSINVGPMGVRRIEGVTVVGIPAVRPRPIGSAVFYSVAPLLAVSIAARRRRAIVCQSPFEAAGVILLTRALPAARRPPVQVELHGDWRTGPRLYGHPARRAVAPLSDRVSAWALRHADRVRVVSERLEELARETGYDGPIDRFVTFSDFRAFLEPAPVALPARPHALFAGVLERYKAVDVLLDAWPDVVDRVPDATLTCVGSGSQHDTLVNQAGDLTTSDFPWQDDTELCRSARENPGVGSVRFVPAVSREELVTMIDASTLLVLPSRSEGLARIVLEAMARGRPVVASDVGGIREVLTDGAQGRIVPVEDATALSDALVDVLGDPGRAASMGAAARATAEAREPEAEYAAGIERMARWLADRNAGRS